MAIQPTISHGTMRLISNAEKRKEQLSHLYAKMAAVYIKLKENNEKLAELGPHTQTRNPHAVRLIQIEEETAKIIAEIDKVSAEIAQCDALLELQN